MWLGPGSDDEQLRGVAVLLIGEGGQDWGDTVSLLEKGWRDFSGGLPW